MFLHSSPEENAGNVAKIYVKIMAASFLDGSHLTEGNHNFRIVQTRNLSTVVSHTAIEKRSWSGKRAGNAPNSKVQVASRRHRISCQLIDGQDKNRRRQLSEKLLRLRRGKIKWKFALR